MTDGQDVDGHAHAVAEAFLDAPRRSPDPVVLAAYAGLSAQADRWFRRLTEGGGRPGIDVVHTCVPEPYATGEELAARVRSERVLELGPARPHPLLDTSTGGAYDRLRAVHDLFSHVGLGFGFDRAGELAAWLAEDRLYRGAARWALATELHAEHSVLWTTGTPAEHKAILLPTSLLAVSRRLGRCGSAAGDGERGPSSSRSHTARRASSARRGSRVHDAHRSAIGRPRRSG